MTIFAPDDRENQLAIFFQLTAGFNLPFLVLLYFPFRNLFKSNVVFSKSKKKNVFQRSEISCIDLLGPQSGQISWVVRKSTESSKNYNPDGILDNFACERSIVLKTRF